MFQKEEQILKLVRDGVNIITLSFESRTVYAYTFKTIKKLKKEGYLTIEKKGRDDIITLTKKGGKIRQKLMEIEELE